MNLAEATIVARLDLDTQRELVARAQAVCRASPLHTQTAGGKPMRVRNSNAGRLGWVADVQGYRYAERDRQGRRWPAIPELWLELANAVAGEHPWDCAHLVWYAPGASLGWHRDNTPGHPRIPTTLRSSASGCASAGSGWPSSTATPSGACATRRSGATAILSTTPTQLSRRCSTSSASSSSRSRTRGNRTAPGTLLWA